MAGLQVWAYHPTLSGSTPDTSTNSRGLLPSAINIEDKEYLNVSVFFYSEIQRFPNKRQHNYRESLSRHSRFLVIQLTGMSILL